MAFASPPIIPTKAPITEAFKTALNEEKVLSACLIPYPSKPKGPEAFSK